MEPSIFVISNGFIAFDDVFRSYMKETAIKKRMEVRP